MGSVVYCETKETVAPYIFSNTRVMAYSYEEVCYYIINNPSLIVAGDFKDEFVLWVNDKLGLTELAAKLDKLVSTGESLERIIDTFLCAYNYLSREEIIMFFERFNEVGQLKDHMRLKKQADGYLNFEKYVRAIRIYKSILELPNLTDAFVADIYHNMGVALAKNLQFIEALNAFEEAYNISGSDITLSCFLSVYFILGQEDNAYNEAKRLGVDDKTYNGILERFKAGSDEYTGSANGKLLLKASEDRKYGKDKDAKKKINELIEEWKSDYRRQTT